MEYEILQALGVGKGGFYHDGRFATLLEVIQHYDACLHLGLAAQEMADLTEYLQALPGDN